MMALYNIVYYHIEFVHFNITTHRIPIKEYQPLVELNKRTFALFFHIADSLHAFCGFLHSQPMNMCLRMSAVLLLRHTYTNKHTHMLVNLLDFMFMLIVLHQIAMNTRYGHTF